MRPTDGASPTLLQCVRSTAVTTKYQCFSLDGVAPRPPKWPAWRVGLERRFHSRNRAAHEGVRRLRRGERCRSARQARDHSRVDRPERRRQDHLLQSADQVSPPDTRPHRLQGPRHHRAGARRCRAARARPLVPDLGGLSSPHRARERAHRAAARPRRLVRFLALQARARRPRRTRHGPHRRCRADLVRRTGRRSNCPTAASARSRSPPRWRSIPKCCCSTSRWPAWDTRTSTASAR